MPKTLIVGLGRSGLGLHWHVIRKLQETNLGEWIRRPVLAWDIRDIGEIARKNGLTPVASLAEARSLMDPGQAIVHLCTPPDIRLQMVRELAGLGFRRMIVEKPLALNGVAAREIESFAKAQGLQLVVVAHWLDSELTHRLIDLTDSQEMGRLRAITFVQRKPRLEMTLRSAAHLTSFDVEVPHSLGVVLRLAGAAELTEASWTGVRIDSRVVSSMATARLMLRHPGGQSTEIFSDLASPIRERRVELEFDDGRAVGYYPSSQSDSFAHLRLVRGKSEEGMVFADDSLTRFMYRVYEQFASDQISGEEFELNVRAAELLGEAKDLALDSGLIDDNLLVTEETLRVH